VDLGRIEAEPQKHFLVAVSRLCKNDRIRDDFLAQSKDVTRLYEAVMPDPIIPDLAPRCQVVAKLAKAIQAQKDPVNITAVLEEISRTLDGSIVAEPHIAPGAGSSTVDLSEINFEALSAKFARSETKNTEAQQLRAIIERKLDKLIRLNASRYDYLDRFQKMIGEYNSGALSIEQLFEQLVDFSKDLNEEEQRHMRENISEEELAVFDILTRPGPELTDKETEAIKKVCKEMLAKLKTEKLVLDWRERRQSRAGVRVAIEEMLDAGLPEKCTADLFEQKCGALFQHVLEKYPQRNVGCIRRRSREQKQRSLSTEGFPDIFDHMTTASVQDLQNDFASLEARLAEGEEIRIDRHGRPIARLVPWRSSRSGEPVTMPDFAARRRRIWGERRFSEAEVEAMRHEEGEDEEG